MTPLDLFFVALWAASAAWIRRDAHQRFRSRGQVRLAVALGLVFPIGGLLLYLLLRPPESLLDRRERRLFRRLLEEELARAGRHPARFADTREARQEKQAELVA